MYHNRYSLFVLFRLQHKILILYIFEVSPVIKQQSSPVARVVNPCSTSSLVLQDDKCCLCRKQMRVYCADFTWR